MKTVEEVIKQLRASNFHGNVTIHFANGQPKKIETKTTEDVE